MMYTREFDHSPRHCWPLNDGRYKIDGSSFYEPEYCEDYGNHPELAGNTEFLRWIREFGVLAPNIVTGFDDGWLILKEDSPKYWPEITVFCENYGNKLKCFYIDSAVIFVELYDDTLVEAAQQAEAKVWEQYRDMKHVASNTA